MTHPTRFSSRRALLLLSAHLMALALLLSACLAAAPSSAPATAPSPQKKPGEFTPAFAAMAYYDDSCRRCHGPQGSFYGTELGKGLTDPQLQKIVNDMANGPGQSPLTPEQLEIETAFHRALVAGTPYLSVTALDGAKISGEVMPDAKVTITVSGKTIEAQVDHSDWTATLPPNAKPQDLTLTADLKGKTTTLLLAKSPYSHSAPVPSPASQPAK